MRTTRTDPTELELHYLRIIVAGESPFCDGSIASAAVGRLIRLGLLFEDKIYPFYHPTERGFEVANR